MKNEHIYMDMRAMVELAYAAWVWISAFLYKEGNSSPFAMYTSSVLDAGIKRTLAVLPHLRLVPLASKCPDAIVARANILWIQIVKIPSQTPESVLARLQ